MKGARKSASKRFGERLKQVYLDRFKENGAPLRQKMDSSRVERILHAKKHLPESLCGIEQETLRITKRGILSEKKHPRPFGAPLTHPFISTDFGEQQLELITPPSPSQQEVLSLIKNIKQFIYATDQQELLWPLSMPCPLPKKIDIAAYGDSFEGSMKTLYRKGLSHRYGQNMQMISGIHFNYSFSPQFWKAFGGTISENYFHMCRNFLRYGWIVTYLYGASPTCDISFRAKGLKKMDPTTLYHPYATSLRMSPHGYYSRIQRQFAVSYNSPNEYIASLRYGIQTPCKEYSHIKEQLNENILQLQNEHYARIRPKPTMDTIEKEGVKYLEIRSIDLDPFEPLGIGKCQYNFIQLFLLYCLAKESPLLTKKEQDLLCTNQSEVSLHGRAPRLMLKNEGKSVSLQDWAHSILDEMEKLSSLLPMCSMKQYRNAVDNPDETLSGRILSYMKKHHLSHAEFGLHLAKKQKEKLLEKPISEKTLKKMQKEGEISFERLQEKEKIDSVLLYGYEDMELSTQFLLRECLLQKISFESIDRNANIVLLTQGDKKEYIRQATKTSLDRYNVVELMGNKEATKRILAQHKIRVPLGGQAHSFQEAETIFSQLQCNKIVVKPNTTNYGQGVHIFPKEEKNQLEAACKVGFSLDASLLVEEYIEGTEYRFLIIGNRCVGVIERDPAHVHGDGTSTIAHLVEQKNLDPSRYRPLSERIHIGSYEIQFLAHQGYTPQTVPKRNQKIYLRENSNVSTGGDAIDRTDEMHQFYKKIALKSAQALGAVICGVDMIVQTISKPGEYGIIELNYNPTLALHERPHQGTPRRVAKHLLKTLGFSITRK